MSPVGPSVAPEPRQPGRGLVVAHAVAFAGAIVVALLSSGLDEWNLPLLAGITVFAIVSDLTHVEVGSSHLKVSGSFLGIVLAAVLMGGGPAAVVGVLTIAVGWLRSREPICYLRNNLVTFAWAPLIGGLFFSWITDVANAGTDSAAYYVFVFATFVVSLAVNYVMVAGYQCYLDRSSFVEKTRETLAPLLAAELFSALLTMAAAYVAARLGTIGLAPFALVLGVFQHLVGELLTSKERSEALRRLAITDELTGLPNRARFRDLVERQISLPEAETDGFAVMLVDLDRFKEINDTLGHHYGDLLLKRIGTRFTECAGERRYAWPASAATSSPSSSAHEPRPADRARTARRPVARVRPGAADGRGAVARDRRQHRHRAVSPGRSGRAHAAPPRRRRDVRRKARPERLPDVRAEPGPPRAPPAQRRERLPPRARLRRDRRPLPADRRARGTPRARRRGARSLGASRARAAAAGRRSCRRSSELI